MQPFSVQRRGGLPGGGPVLPLHFLAAVDAENQPGQGILTGAVVPHPAGAAAQPLLGLLEKGLGDQGRVLPRGDDPLFRGIGEGADRTALPLALVPVPDHGAGVHRVPQDEPHGAPGKAPAPPGHRAHGIEGLGDGGGPGPFLDVEVEDEPHHLSLLRDDLQGGPFVDDGFPVAVGGVGQIAPLVHGLADAPLHPPLDELQLPAGQEGLELGVLLVQLVVQVVDLPGGDDPGAGVFEGVQDDPLVAHPPAAQPVDVHAEDPFIPPGGDVFKQPQHLRTGVKAVAADHLLVDGGYGVPTVPGQGQEGLPVAL